MLKSVLKNLYYLGLAMARTDKSRIGQIRREKKVAILNLHRVSPQENPFWSPLDPKVFEELLKFLKSDFQVLTFGTLDAIGRSDKPAAILSFDDGYYDFIEYALPLLEKYGMQANMNIIPQCAESGNPIWNVRLYDFLNSAPRKLISDIKLPGFDAELKDGSRPAKVIYGLKLSRFLKNRPRGERENIWREIEPYLEKADFPQTRMMTAAEIRGIAAVTEIGVHSFSHESMGFEPDGFFEQDFASCRDYFAEKLQLPLTAYAFPNGSYRDTQIDFLRQNGIKHILLVDEKLADTGTDVYPRLTVYGDSRREIRFKSLGF
jgi:peptidoglycan/xylan/chitin deacetylase (PgdA/CDA1 family)